MLIKFEFTGIVSASRKSKLLNLAFFANRFLIALRPIFFSSASKRQFTRLLIFRFSSRNSFEPSSKTIISKFLASDLLVLLGKSSYAFYLIHIGIFMITLEKIKTNTFYLFVFLNLIAIFFYLYIEKPSNVYFRNRNLRK